MPEIVEVQIQTDGLQEIVNQTIKEVKLHDGAKAVIKYTGDFEKSLEGSRIEQIFRIGKYIVFELSKAQTESNKRDFLYMLVHLAMTGGFLINKLHSHTRITFQLEKDTLYYNDTRKFGSILILNADGLKRYISLRKLGEDALNASKYEIEIRLIEELFKPKNKNRSIKSLLLDQSIICGLGNIYANEVLFRSGIHPLLTPKDISLDDISRIAAQISEVLNESYKMGGSSIRDYSNVHGEKGKYQNHYYVYRRNGKPCRKCGTEIEKIEIEGRSTFYCSVCQSQ